jgi:hypothetical protein
MWPIWMRGLLPAKAGDEDGWGKPSTATIKKSGLLNGLLPRCSEALEGNAFQRMRLTGPQQRHRIIERFGESDERIVVTLDQAL